MNRLGNSFFKAVLAAFLGLGFDAWAATADPPTASAADQPAVAAKPDEAPAKAEDAAGKPAAADRSAHDAALAQISAVGQKIEARKKAIVADNQAAAAIDVEIEAMAREVQKIAESMALKQAELAKILDADKAMAELNREMGAAYETLRKAKEALKEERIKSHREHLMLPDLRSAAGKAAEEEAK